MFLRQLIVFLSVMIVASIGYTPGATAKYRITVPLTDSVLEAVPTEPPVVLAKGGKRPQAQFKQAAKKPAKRTKPAATLNKSIAGQRKFSVSQRVKDMKPLGHNLAVSKAATRQLSESAKKVVEEFLAKKPLTTTRLSAVQKHLSKKASQLNVRSSSGSVIKRSTALKVKTDIRGALRAHTDMRNARSPILLRAESKLDASTKLAFKNYSAGRIGQAAKSLAPKVAKLSKNEFLKFMRSEVKSGRALESSRKPQPTKKLGRSTKMRIWEYKDGTVVRYKPGGDPRRPHPTYSIEVKKLRSAPDKKGGIQGIAFKVDKNGRAMPKWPSDMPTKLGKAYIDTVMSATHRIFKE